MKISILGIVAEGGPDDLAQFCRALQGITIVAAAALEAPAPLASPAPSEAPAPLVSPEPVAAPAAPAPLTSPEPVAAPEPLSAAPAVEVAPSAPAAEAVTPPKRGRGRPRKNPLPVAAAVAAPAPAAPAPAAPARVAAPPAPAAPPAAPSGPLLSGAALLAVADALEDRLAGARAAYLAIAASGEAGILAAEAMRKAELPSRHVGAFLSAIRAYSQTKGISEYTLVRRLPTKDGVRFFPTHG